jgi:hypothetical protein
MTGTNARHSRTEKLQRLFELAAGQAGHFTAAQARDLGYSARSLVHHVAAGHVERVSRGFYRLPRNCAPRRSAALLESDNSSQGRSKRLASVRDYATPAAFRAAVEARLRERARRLSAPTYMVRRQAALDRLLVRLPKVAPGRWALKGGGRRA